MCLTLQPLGLTSPGQNTGVVSLSLLQGIIPTQGSNPTLQEDSLPAEPQGKPKKVEWVAYSFSSRSFQPRNQTRVSCITGRFFLPIELSGWPIVSQIHRFRIIRSWESQSKISVSKFPDFQTLTTNLVFKKYCPGQRKNSLPIMLHKITWITFLSLPTSSSLFSSLHCPNLMIRSNF